VPAEIDWTTLSEAGQATMRRIALPLSMGYSLVEIANSLEMPTRSVRLLVDSLAAELER
jgi:hypothetical protein